MVSQILSGLDGVQCYLEDIVVFAETPSLHEKRLKAVLQQHWPEVEHGQVPFQAN